MQSKPNAKLRKFNKFRIKKYNNFHNNSNRIKLKKSVEEIPMFNNYLNYSKNPMKKYQVQINCFNKKKLIWKS